MRFIATGGVLKGVLKPDDEITTDEMLTSSEEVEETDERRIAFQYHREHRRYAYAQDSVVTEGAECPRTDAIKILKLSSLITSSP